ncbi:MAG: hypothetical protein WC309_02700 [Candidatus Paceibacterota bacterium]|jgi:hypothetical protein
MIYKEVTVGAREDEILEKHRHAKFAVAFARYKTALQKLFQTVGELPDDRRAWTPLQRSRVARERAQLGGMEEALGLSGSEVRDLRSEIKEQTYGDSFRLIV